MTKEQALEWLKCAYDEQYWINTYVQIKDPIEGVIPFTLYEYQNETLSIFNDNRKVIILKARQMGISWLVSAHSLHTAMFGEAKWVLIVSKRESDAYDLMERIQFMYDRLPEWMKPAVTERNKGTIGFSNESKIESQPTTKDAGRGRPPSLLIIDEFAYCRHDKDLLNSAETALARGGKCILLSTANGYGNEFARLWFGSQRRKNNYRAIFLPWYAVPGRTPQWLADETKGWPSWRISQEFPGSWEEAFRQTGRPVFDHDCLRLTASVVEPIDLGETVEDMRRRLQLDKVRVAPAFQPGSAVEDDDVEYDDDEVVAAHPDADYALIRFRHNLMIFQLPKPEACYLIGADVAEGLAHGDNSSVTVIDRETQEEVACWYGKIKPYDFAALLYELSQLYVGLLIPERNNHGQSVCALLEAWNTPHLYWQKPLWDKVTGKRVRERKSGWETTGANKTMMIDELAMALKLGWYKPASPLFLHEAEKYETRDDGKYSAPDGYTDDAVMSTAIAWQGRKHLVLFEGMSSGIRRESLRAEDL